MVLLKALQTAGGLSVLHLVQTILFASMVYILSAEYLRTLKPDLVYKLIASFSIMILNLLSTALYFLIEFENMRTSDKYFPLIHNSIFVIIILALAKAFIYDFLSDSFKKKFDLYFNSNIILLILAYGILQYFWARSFSTESSFKESWFQLLFSGYFIITLVILIWITIKYRERYQYRVAIAFAAIIIVQAINVIHFFNGHSSGAMKIIQALAPVLIPAMFGSVVFKELIANNSKLLMDLKESFQTQKGVIHDMDHMCLDLGKLATRITQKSTNSWTRLLDLKLLVENLSQNSVMMEKIRNQSREIEETAAQADALNGLIDEIQKKNHDLASIVEKINYVNE